VIPLSDEKDLRDCLLLLRPDKRFVGIEYKDTVFTGSDIEGIEIVYLERSHSFSSSDLRQRVLDAGEIKHNPNSVSISDIKNIAEYWTVPRCLDDEAIVIKNTPESDPDLEDVGKQDY
jgi:hypothetical protein